MCLTKSAFVGEKNFNKTIATCCAPDDGLQIRPKHLEVDWQNKLRLTSASSSFLLHRCIEMHSQQNIKERIAEIHNFKYQLSSLWELLVSLPATVCQCANKVQGRDARRSWKNSHVSAMLCETELLLLLLSSSYCILDRRLPGITVNTRTYFTHWISYHLEMNHIANTEHKTFFLKI
jgi:hypothetical protein